MKQTSRLASIDCFRGFAVLVMVLATYLFGTEALPAWLRHAPDGSLNIIDLGAPLFIIASQRDMADGYELVVLKYLDSTTRCQHGSYRADLYRIRLHLSRAGAAAEQTQQFLESGHCGIP